MSVFRKAKEAQVKEISKKISDSQAIVVAEYHGLTVADLQELRLQLGEKDVELKVYKNRIFKLAAKESGIEAINDELTGPNIYAFGMSDDISPAKVIAEFAKKHKALKLKAGTYEGKVIGLQEVLEVATLPTYEEALTKLALALMTPLKDTSISLNLLVEEGHIGGSKEEVKEDVAEAKNSVATPSEETKEAGKTEDAKEEASLEKEEQTQEAK